LIVANNNSSIKNLKSNKQSYNNEKQFDSQNNFKRFGFIFATCFVVAKCSDGGQDKALVKDVDTGFEVMLFFISRHFLNFDIFIITIVSIKIGK
jgi:hypothetical protein